MQTPPRASSDSIGRLSTPVSSAERKKTRLSTPQFDRFSQHASPVLHVLIGMVRRTASSRKRLDFADEEKDDGGEELPGPSPAKRFKSREDADLRALLAKFRFEQALPCPLFPQRSEEEEEGGEDSALKRRQKDARFEAGWKHLTDPSSSFPSEEACAWGSSSSSSNDPTHEVQRIRALKMAADYTFSQCHANIPYHFARHMVNNAHYRRVFIDFLLSNGLNPRDRSFLLDLYRSIGGGRTPDPSDFLASNAATLELLMPMCRPFTEEGGFEDVDSFVLLVLMADWLSTPVTQRDGNFSRISRECYLHLAQCVERSTHPTVDSDDDDDDDESSSGPAERHWEKVGVSVYLPLTRRRSTMQYAADNLKVIPGAEVIGHLVTSCETPDWKLVAYCVELLSDRIEHEEAVDAYKRLIDFDGEFIKSKTEGWWTSFMKAINPLMVRAKPCGGSSSSGGGGGGQPKGEFQPNVAIASYSPSFATAVMKLGSDKARDLCSDWSSSSSTREPAQLKRALNKMFDASEQLISYVTFDLLLLTPLKGELCILITDYLDPYRSVFAVNQPEQGEYTKLVEETFVDGRRVRQAKNIARLMF